MRELALERTQRFRRPLDDTFAFFADPGNLEAITPDWLRFRIVEAPERIADGARLRYRLRLFGVAVGWRTEIVSWRPPHTFVDVQRSGPYPLWEHTHRFAAVGDETEMYDHVRYRVPGGPLAPLVARIVRRWLDAIFDYRAAELARLLDPNG
jgi:ligand-binding SRPBCC domain-containing protein